MEVKSQLLILFRQKKNLLKSRKGIHRETFPICLMWVKYKHHLDIQLMKEKKRNWS